MANVTKEKIEIAIEDGKQYAYFRGVKLPMLVESKVLDGLDDAFSYAELKFIVNLVKEPTKINESVNCFDVNKLVLDNITNYDVCRREPITSNEFRQSFNYPRYDLHKDKIETK